MGNLVPISLGVRSNPSRHAKQAGNARLINCFAEEIGEEGKSPTVITACPGLTTFGEQLGSAGIREMLEVDGNMFTVSGSTLYKLDVSANVATIGSIPTSTASVYMRRNRAAPVQIGIVSDGWYGVVQSDVLSTIDDADLPPPTSFAYLDGYGILPVTRGRYYITGIDNFSTIDALDEGTAESNPDPIVRALELDREVLLFGPKSLEAHGNSGGADFPLSRSQAMEVGTPAADSCATVDTATGRAVMFVAQDHSVRLMSGYLPQTVSPGWVEDLIKRLAEAGDIATLKTSAYSWGGRSFYYLSCDDWTIGYDVKSGLWHERKSYGMNRWRVGPVSSFGPNLIAGDYATGQLYRVQDEAYDEAGNPLVMEIITPTVHMAPYGGIVNALHLDIVSGVGLNSTADHNENPVALVDWSKDGGETWGAPREVNLHRLGQTGRRVQPLYRLGRFGQKGITFRIRISASVKKVVLSAHMDVERLELGMAS